MKNWYSEKIIINDTNIDYSNTVPITELMRMFEIVTFNHSNLLKLDHNTMEKKSNAFWVVTKMKVIPCSQILSGDKVGVTTWMHELGTVRALRDCIIKNGNKIKAKFIAEWCCLDCSTRQLRRMNTIAYPSVEMEKTNHIKTKFSNTRESVDTKDFVYERKIRLTDIDINNHTNNLKYNFMVFDAFSLKEMNSIQIKEYEIYFVNESHEGDEIQVYKRKAKTYYYIEGRCGDKVIFRSIIKFKKLS